MSWYRNGIEKNLKKIEMWITVEEAKLQALYYLKGKYASYLKDYDAHIRRMKNGVEKLRMDKIIKKMHKEFYQEYDKYE